MGKNENHKQKTFDDANLTCYFTDPRSINLSFRILFHLCFTKLGISKPESITNGNPQQGVQQDPCQVEAAAFAYEPWKAW